MRRPFRAIVKHIALMLFARQTSCAVRANAPTAPQAQRAEKTPATEPHLRSGSQRMTSEGDSESIRFMKGMCPQTQHTSRKLLTEKLREPAILKAIMGFPRQKLSSVATSLCPSTAVADDIWPREWLRGGASSFRHPHYPERFRIPLNNIFGSPKR